MRNKPALAALVVVMLLFLMGFERKAYAYTDPGSGLLAVQYFFSLAAGALFYFRRSIARIFRSRSSETPSDKEQPAVNDGNSPN